MKQAYLKLLVVLFGVFCGVKAFAYDCEVDGIYYYRISATELEVANKVFSDQNRSAYTGAVTIPATVTYMGKTFNVVSIGEYAFRDCQSLTSVSIPSSVKSIKSFAFYNCSQVANITIPASVTSIGMGAFEGCATLSSMVIPSGVTTIGDEMFYGCTMLKSIVLPSTVNAIGASAFSRCTSLISIYCMAATAPTCEDNAFDKVDRTWCTLYVAKGAKSYQDHDVWGDFFTEEFTGRVEDIPIQVVKP